jgi:urease accessory protein
MGVVAAAGFLHGYAHGGEAAPGTTAALYFSGFLLATAVLHAAGLAFAVTALRGGSPRAARIVRGAGFAVAAFSAALALGLA